MAFEITQAIALLGLGFILGLKHAFEPDHIAAVSTLVKRNTKLSRAAIFGAMWGIGHTSTLLIAGIIVLTFKLVIPEGVASSLEFIVGIMLVVLGLNVLKEVWQKRMHIHKHDHVDKEHLHLHAHDKSDSHGHLHRPFLIGAIHGLAGSGALVLLVLATVTSLELGVAYILIFGVGSMIGMLTVGATISASMKLISKYTKLEHSLEVATGLFSIIFGIIIMSSIAL